MVTTPDTVTFPRHRFASDALSHLALSLIFSYYVLDEISPAIAWLDILLMVWFFAIMCEEFRQVSS